VIMESAVRHILSLSGGKDSTALAIYMRERVPDMEYVFCDTDKELAETYEYLERLEAFLGRKIVRLRDDRGFDHWLRIYGNYLPSSRMRWCTKMLKIRPFERYVGDHDVMMYIGIRADEDRSGYISSKPNINPVYPFIQDGLGLPDIHRILEESGIGFPKYYSWRTRSGCFFCFFQRKHEWVGLKENHPELFEEAKRYEKMETANGDRYTWSERESLEELEQPERVKQIKDQHRRALEEQSTRRPNRPLLEILGEDDDDALPCSFCQV